MTRRTTTTLQHGMTVLEIMVVLAIIGGLMFIARTGFRRITRADLVENANELRVFLQRASNLAIERGEMHRVVLDLDKQVYAVEVCQGAITIARNEQVKGNPEEVQRALDRAKQRMGQMPAEAFASGDPEEGAKRAGAIAGHHIQDRTCALVTGGISGDTTGKAWTRALFAEKGIKFKEVWVQHLDDSVKDKGQVAIYFFPMGTAEKAVIELTDGSDTFSILVSGLTARVELRDSPLSNVDDHMLRNVMGQKDKARESDE
jgi:prepilin-type N-terminal cleavage/methylation domain-containing protein